MISKSEEKKVRMWLAIAVIIVVAVFALTFFQFESNLDPKFVVDIDNEGYAVIRGYTGNVSSLVITPKVLLDGKEYEVRYIAADAFSSHYSILEEVVIADTVTWIGDNAFSDLPELEKVVLPKNLETIGKEAFARCHQLTDIELPEGLKTIDDEAFYGCVRLGHLYVPASVGTIGRDAFAACESLLLDVSDNPVAAAVAEEYAIETGRVQTTYVYFFVALAVGLLLFVGILLGGSFLKKKVKAGRKAKNPEAVENERAEQEKQDEI